MQQQLPNENQGAILAGAALIAVTLNAQTTATVTDLDILNYALRLEQMEANFYTEGLKRFSSSDFAGGGFATNLGNLNGMFGDSVSGDVYGNLLLIRNHEQAHVRSLMRTIRAAGGALQPACTYKFEYNNVDEFLALAIVLEDTGVSAYGGALQLIKDARLVTVAATIATVEARHASYVRLIGGEMPFPAALDATKSMQTVLSETGPFVVCAG